MINFPLLVTSADVPLLHDACTMECPSTLVIFFGFTAFGGRRFFDESPSSPPRRAVPILIKHFESTLFNVNTFDADKASE